MVVSSVIFICTFFGLETLTEVSTKTLNDPNNHSTVVQIPMDQEQPVVLIKNHRRQIVTTIKEINRT